MAHIKLKLLFHSIQEKKEWLLEIISFADRFKSERFSAITTPLK